MISPPFTLGLLKEQSIPFSFVLDGHVRGASLRRRVQNDLHGVEGRSTGATILKLKGGATMGKLKARCSRGRRGARECGRKPSKAALSGEVQELWIVACAPSGGTAGGKYSGLVLGGPTLVAGPRSDPWPAISCTECGDMLFGWHRSQDTCQGPRVEEVRARRAGHGPRSRTSALMQKCAGRSGEM